jgi:hypothetical protein
MQSMIDIALTGEDFERGKNAKKKNCPSASKGEALKAEASG